MIAPTPQQLEKLLARRNLLAERASLLKEYLLRPVRESRYNETSILSAESIKQAQVLPEDLFSAMQDAYHKATRDLDRLEKIMRSTGRFVQTDGGVYRIVAP